MCVIFSSSGLLRMRLISQFSRASGARFSETDDSPETVVGRWILPAKLKALLGSSTLLSQVVPGKDLMVESKSPLFGITPVVVDQKHALAGLCQRARKVIADRGFANPAFLVQGRDDGHAIPSLGCWITPQVSARLYPVYITLAPKKLILTRRASEGSASEPSLARRVSMCKDAKLSCRGNKPFREIPRYPDWNRVYPTGRERPSRVIRRVYGDRDEKKTSRRERSDPPMTEPLSRNGSRHEWHSD